MDLSSSAFGLGETMAVRYTCDGQNVSPPLAWKSVPADTQALVLVCEDPDASSGTFSHWVLYNVPVDVDKFAEHLTRDGRLPWGGMQGRNDMGKLGYDGPCPPHGAPHRYYFRLYAIDEALDLTPGATRAQVLSQIHDHLLDQSELMVRYSRR